MKQQLKLRNFCHDLKIFNVSLYLKSVRAEICGRHTMDNKFPQLTPLTLDLLTDPASEAYVERILSPCGDLTTGKHNRIQQSLEHGVHLKLNTSLFQ